MSQRDAGTPTSILHDWRHALKGGTVPVPCDGCTSCCRSAMPINLYNDEAKRLPHVIGEDGKPKLARNGRDCIMFDAEAGRCSIYEERPLVCRTFDCRQLWMSGFRNIDNGKEVNERLDEWSMQVHNDLDLGIVAVVWSTARDARAQGIDIGMAAAIAAGSALVNYSKEDLRKIGAQARRGGIENVLKVLNRE